MKHIIIGGSDAGISAALRIKELAPQHSVTVLLADAYPNYSICGIPFYLSREVKQWSDLAHRKKADLEAAGRFGLELFPAAEQPLGPGANGRTSLGSGTESFKLKRNLTILAYGCCIANAGVRASALQMPMSRTK